MISCINFLNELNYFQKSNLCNLLSSFGLRVIVNEITRPYTLNSGSCIDNVVTSLPCDRISATVIPTIGSDHDAIFFKASFIDNNNSSTHNLCNSTSLFVSRPLNDFGRNYFSYLLENINWLPLYTISCVDEMFRFFIDIFLDVLDTVLPLKYFSTRVNSRYKWYDSKLKQFKKECISLFQLYKRDQNNISRQNYLNCKRKYLNEIKIAKCNYNNNVILNANNKSKAIWKIINDTLGKNNIPMNTLNLLTADSFNEFFVNKIDDLIKNIKPSNFDNTNYLHNSVNNFKVPINSGFFFHEVTVGF